MNFPKIEDKVLAKCRLTNNYDSMRKLFNCNKVSLKILLRDIDICIEYDTYNLWYKTSGVFKGIVFKSIDTGKCMKPMSAKHLNNKFLSNKANVITKKYDDLIIYLGFNYLIISFRDDFKYALGFNNASIRSSTYGLIEIVADNHILFVNKSNGDISYEV